MKTEKLRQFIDADTKERIGCHKKLMGSGEDAEEYYTKEMNEMKTRGQYNTMRPPEVWNFFDDKAAHEKVRHVLRYNANPAACYKDGRVERIMKNIEEIGMNLSRYEEQKWKTLRKHTMAVFAKLYSDFKTELDAA